jgi:AhpD family alkylhydroperoxidase
MGFPSPPNFILTQGHAPNVARGTWEAVRNVLLGGEIPRWIKELMFLAISVDRQCSYCAAAHAACCRMLHVNPEWTEAVRLLFGLKAARSPQSLAPEDFSKLRSYGLRQAEIMELIGMAAFAVYANIIADATAMDGDPMFEQL